jgi:ribosomal protein L40E
LWISSWTGESALRRGVKIWARTVDEPGMSAALARQAPYPVRVQQRRCGKCGKLVSAAAYACRRCGKTQRIRPKTILLVLASGLMVGMFAVASASVLLPQSRPAEAAVPAARPAGAGALVASGRTNEVSATDLWMTYSRDTAAAERLYRDRSLTVTGIVRSIDRNYEGEMVVRLATGDTFDTVNATLATRNDPALGTLVKGRSVSLLCMGRGALMGAPQLGGCFLR